MRGGTQGWTEVGDLEGFRAASNTIHNLVVKGCYCRLLACRRALCPGLAFVENLLSGLPSRGRRGRSEETWEGQAALFLSRILLEAVADQRGRIARCHSNRNQTAKTPHCNHLPQVRLALALAFLHLAIYPSLPPPPGSPHDRPRILDLVIRLRIYLPSVRPETKIMPLVQFLLVLGKQLPRAYTSL